MIFSDNKKSHKRYHMTIAIKEVVFDEFKAAAIHDDPGDEKLHSTIHI